MGDLMLTDQEWQNREDALKFRFQHIRDTQVKYDRIFTNSYFYRDVDFVTRSGEHKVFHRQHKRYVSKIMLRKFIKNRLHVCGESLEWSMKDPYIDLNQMLQYFDAAWVVQRWLNRFQRRKARKVLVKKMGKKSRALELWEGRLMKAGETPTMIERKFKQQWKEATRFVMRGHKEPTLERIKSAVRNFEATKLMKACEWMEDASNVAGDTANRNVNADHAVRLFEEANALRYPQRVLARYRHDKAIKDAFNI